MADPARPGTAVPPRLRIRLSLRWKAFGMLLLLLGAVHAFYGIYAFHQALAAFKRQESERLQRAPQMFDELLRQSAQNLGRIGAQIAAGTSTRELARHPLDEGRISPELLASLSEVGVFDGAGHRIGGLTLDGGNALPAELETRLIAAVRRLRRPASTLWCDIECRAYVLEPALDRNGTELLISLGQPVTEILPAFSRQSGVDIALLSASGAPSQERLLGRRLYAITNAPVLLPRLREVAANLDIPSGQAMAASPRQEALMLLLSPLAQTEQGAVLTLFIADETPALERIRQALRRGIALSFAGLLLSGGVLWWSLRPLSRRLRTVTRALPLLADKRFAEATALLGSASPSGRLTDELDLLGHNARWLARRLQELDKAEAASAAKTRFLATLSHEVRTPLNGILGLLEVLQHTHLDWAQRESIGMVRASAQSLMGVLDDTIDLARIESGRVDLNLAPFSVEQVLAGCAETAAPRARAKKLKLITYTDPSLPAMLSGDAMRLRQVLNNLCSNAVKFTAAGRVVARAEMVGRIAGKVRVRFSVQDSGVGIPQDVQKDLFQPFQQGGCATASRYGGSGLGLSICQGLVRRMGGRIGFVSTPGAGSEFSFWLELAIADGGPAPRRLPGLAVALRLSEPDERAWITSYLRDAGVTISDKACLVLRENGPAGLLLEPASGRPVALSYPVHRSALLNGLEQAAQPRPAAPMTMMEPPARRLRVLAVDDHPTNRAVIQRQLVLLGHDAVTADDAQAALRAIDDRACDVLLTDLRMPGMSGIELARETRGRERTGKLRGRLPVIVLSAHFIAGDIEQCRDAGVDLCLTKPVSLDQLRQALAPWSSGAGGSGLPAPVEQAVPPPPLQSLATLLGGDEQQAARLLKEFVRINTPLVAGLAALAEQGNCEGLAANAHRLLGSARTVGAAELAGALGALEQRALEQCREELPCLAADVAREYGRVREQLETVSV